MKKGRIANPTSIHTTIAELISLLYTLERANDKIAAIMLEVSSDVKVLPSTTADSCKLRFKLIKQEPKQPLLLYILNKRAHYQDWWSEDNDFLNQRLLRG